VLVELTVTVTDQSTLILYDVLVEAGLLADAMHTRDETRSSTWEGIA
jgi:hypothetical protein